MLVIELVGRSETLGAADLSSNLESTRPLLELHIKVFISENNPGSG